MSDPNPTRSKNTPVRACTNCVRAKVKCSAGAPHGACERCTRLNKDCQPSPPVRKRRPRVERNNGKIDKLEERLDDLVVLLQSAVNNRSSASSSAADEPAVASVLPPPIPSPPPLALAQPEPHQQPLAPFSQLHPSGLEAETYLNRFRDLIVGDLPFLILSPSLTAQQLRHERPLLWLAIMTVASTRPAQQNALSKEMRRVFGQEAFTNGTRSMDFLLAVLVYVAWDRWYVIEKSNGATLIHLATSIMYELGLDKPFSHDAGVFMMHDLKGCKRPDRVQQTPGLDERRVVLACYLLSTVPSQHCRGESLRWTSYFDQCLHVLAEQKESPSDMLLVQLVKLRQLAGTAIEYLTSTYGIESDSNFLRPDASIMLKSLQSQLHTLKSTIPPDLLSNKPLLLLELQTTECTIHQLAFLPPATTFLAPGQTFAAIYASMQSVKTWIDTFFTILPVQYIAFSALTHASIVRCLVNLYRLATYDHPEWDRSLLHQMINVSWVLEETGTRFAQVSRVAGVHSTDEFESTFDRIAKRIGLMKGAWDELVRAQQQQQQTPVSGASSGVDVDASTDIGVSMDQAAVGIPFDFVDFWDWPS